MILTNSSAGSIPGIGKIFLLFSLWISWRVLQAFGKPAWTCGTAFWGGGGPLRTQTCTAESNSSSSCELYSQLCGPFLCGSSASFLARNPYFQGSFAKNSRQPMFRKLGLLQPPRFRPSYAILRASFSINVYGVVGNVCWPLILARLLVPRFDSSPWIKFLAYVVLSRFVDKLLDWAWILFRFRITGSIALAILTTSLKFFLVYFLFNFFWHELFSLLLLDFSFLLASPHRDPRAAIPW